MPDIYNNGVEAPTKTLPERLLPAGGGRGIRVENLAGLVDVPNLDPRGAQAYAAGAEALGKGIVNAGGALGEIVQIQQKAINVNRVATFDAAVDGMKNQVAELMAREPDETKWGGIAENALKQLRENKDVFRDDLGPLVTDHIEAKMEGLKAGWVGEVKVNSARESIRKAERVVQANISSSILNQNQAGADAGFDQLVVAGKLTKEEADLGKRKAADEIARVGRQKEIQDQKSNYEILQKQIRLDPSTEIPEDVNITEAMRHALEKSKKTSINDRAVNIGNQLSEEVYSRMSDEDPAKRIANEGMIEDLAREIPGATEKQIYNAKVLYRKLDNADHRQWVQDNGLVNMAKARQYVQEYRPADDKDRSKYDELKSWIYASVPAANRPDAMALLTAKVKPGSAIPKTDPVLKIVQQRLDQVKNQGLFGNIYSDKNKMDPATGRQVTRNGVPVKDVDIEKLSKVQDKAAALEGHMRQWMIDNPEKAKNSEAAIKELNSQMPKATLAGALQAAYDAFSGKSPAPQTEGEMDDVATPPEPIPASEPAVLEQPPEEPEPPLKKPTPKGSADFSKPDLPDSSASGLNDVSLLPTFPQ